jgi:hypothetical protein
MYDTTIKDIIDNPPIYLPKNWNEFINEKENKINLDIIRNCINRQAPLGEKNWQEKIVKKYGLESTINPRGRPKKSNSSPSAFYLFSHFSHKYTEKTYML